MKNILTDNDLAVEDWKSLFLITLIALVVAVLFILETKLNTPISCTPDYCMDEFCIILKEGK